MEDIRETTVIERSELTKIYEAINEMKVKMSELATILSLRKQPCQWHEELEKRINDHILEHKENKRDLKQTMLQICAGVIASGIIAIAGILIGMRLKA
jgi:hypothetical protein